MILYASQRANAAELAKHLLNDAENDHVTVHEIRGFVSDDLAEALREAYAMSRGTRCRQFLFSVSLNPPEDVDVPIEAFEAAIEEIERKLSLVGQPRIIVFHEKNGRRHCHTIWSRIDAEKLTAINMAHFKRKLMEISRYLFLKHGWKLPKGMQRGEERRPALAAGNRSLRHHGHRTAASARHQGGQYGSHDRSVGRGANAHCAIVGGSVDVANRS